MVVRDDADLAVGVSLLKECGWRQRHVSEVAGVNSHLDESQAVILRVNLRYLDPHNEGRRGLAELYHESLLSDSLIRPAVAEGAEPVHQQYVVCSLRRDELRGHLQS